MKASIILCVVFVAVIARANEEPDNAFKALKKECADENKVTTEQLEKLHADHFKTDSENVKCFVKCMLNKSEVLSDHGVDIEKTVIFGGLAKKDPVLVREKAEKCKDLFKGSNDCDTAIKLLECFKET